MDTTIKIILRDTPSKTMAIIEEEGAEAVEYWIDDDSLNSMAWSVGQAVMDYLEGLG